MITKEAVLNLFDYKDGELFWKKSRQGITRKDRKAGCKDRIYYRIGIDGKMYLLHQIVFLYHHGYIPKEIDHIDRNGFNNRIENLREVDSIINNRNRGTPKNNTTGAKNVYFDKKTNKWRVILVVRGKKKEGGSYFDFDKAKEVAQEMRDFYH